MTMGPNRGYKRKTRGGRGRHVSQNISKKQRSDLKEYGELHPADREDGHEKYRKVEYEEEDRSRTKTQTAASSSESENEEESSAFDQLLSTIGASSNQNTDSDSEHDSEEDTLVDVSQSSTIDEEDETDDSITDEEVQGEGSSEESGSEGDESEDDQEEEEEDGEEEEEDAESDEDEEEEYDEDNEEGASKSSIKNSKILSREVDPFSLHFERDCEDSFIESLDKPSSWSREDTKAPFLGQCSVTFPAKASKPILGTKERDLTKSCVKPKLLEEVRETNRNLGKVNVTEKEQLSALQHSLFSIINNYHDLQFPEETVDNLEEIRLVYCVHALNHVLKTRTRVVTHNKKLKAKDTEVTEDQGLTRPKVLIIAPFRDSALKIINMFISLLHKGDQTNVMNSKRFVQEFQEEEDQGFEKQKKPEDYEALFSGNIDDHFRIGMSVTKKSLKLYSKFYGSDIIVASPLGLRTIIGAEEEEDRDFDFLSSIEVLIFDQTDLYLMQNWDHVLHLMNHMHLQPKESHGVDFSRVRLWSLNGWSKYYRQTLIFSSMACPETNALFNKSCHNYAGKVVVPKVYTSGAICQIVTQLPQVFMRVDTPSYAELADARFNFFLKKILREHRDPVMARTMIFIPSYFDYVRIRNYFKKEEIDFLSICEYTKEEKVRKVRKSFMRGKSHFLLYTERFHFFNRLRVRGVKHLVFYELPRYAHFYSELSNTLMGAKHGQADTLSCHVIYAKYDVQRLAAIVGSDRAGHMITSERSVHLFVTGDS